MKRVCLVTGLLIMALSSVSEIALAGKAFVNNDGAYAFLWRNSPQPPRSTLIIRDTADVFAPWDAAPPMELGTRILDLDSSSSNLVYLLRSAKLLVVDATVIGLHRIAGSLNLPSGCQSLNVVKNTHGYVSHANGTALVDLAVPAKMTLNGFFTGVYTLAAEELKGYSYLLTNTSLIEYNWKNRQALRIYPLAYSLVRDIATIEYDLLLAGEQGIDVYNVPTPGYAFRHKSCPIDGGAVYKVKADIENIFALRNYSVSIPGAPPKQHTQLLVIDRQLPTLKTKKSLYLFSGLADNFDLRGNYLYVSQRNKLWIYDVSCPESPKLASFSTD